MVRVTRLSITDSLPDGSYRAMSFQYGPDRERWYSELTDDGVTSRSTVYAGNYEKVTDITSKARMTSIAGISTFCFLCRDGGAMTGPWCRGGELPRDSTPSKGSSWCAGRCSPLWKSAPTTGCC